MSKRQHNDLWPVEYNTDREQKEYQTLKDDDRLETDSNANFYINPVAKR